MLNFDSKAKVLDEKNSSYMSVRELFNDDDNVYVMDAKNAGNIGRFLNVSILTLFIIFKQVTLELVKMDAKCTIDTSA